MYVDQILTNGKFYTMDGRLPFATAVAIRDGRIVAVGNDGDTADWSLAPHGQRHNLNGATVTPGLVDAHCHFQWYAISLLQVDLYEVPSKAEAQARVAARAAQQPHGQWVQGRGWKCQIWEDPSWPTAADLDPISPHHPVLLRDKSGHTAWANSLALQLAGVNEQTPNPAGGEIGRDEHGRPTGMLFETAIRLVADHIPDYTHQQLVEAMRVAQRNCWAVGLTGLHDFDGRDSFMALQELHRHGELGLRVYKNIPVSHLDEVIGLGLRTDFGDEWLRLGGIKIFADGALGGRTALMVEPYEREPSNYGIAVTDKEEMMAHVSRASAHGLSVTIHAIGDRAVHDVLDAYEAARREEAQRGASQPALRHRIEHVQIYHPADKLRLAQLGIIASMQPVHAISDMVMADAAWGARAQYSYAWRDMLASGAPLVFGSDFPVEEIDPLRGIYAAVARRQIGGDYAPAEGWYASQKLTMPETIRAFTLAAAETSGQQATQGSISVGKAADFTLFDSDLFAIPTEEVLDTKVVGTITGGVWRFRGE
ncbi:MAG: amidohydrolase [Chloroflexi bacterium]|nr:amidohydrolase [Chloroflexota bacterium]